jgi:Ni/Co efflux regulator RcnB
MKRSLLIAAALTVATAGAAAAQDHRDDERGRPPHPPAAPHSPPPGASPGPGAPAARDYRGGPPAVGYRGPPTGRDYRDGSPAIGYRGPPAGPGCRGGPPAGGYRGRPGAGDAHFDGFRGQGIGPHGPAQVFYHGRSFSSFRAAPFYYPGGWGYRRWGVGQFLPGAFLTQSYFIGNWGAYGLGPPPPGLQWVRYGPDALLVNVYTGQVVDTVYGVFWW